MRRADRLFRILQRLRRRGVTTASALAEALEVSERTIYRDVRDLQISGVPIVGEAGVGYALPKGYDLPPLMFSEEEIEALVLGARIVKSWADAELARAADDVLAKVESVLPQRLKERIPDATLFAPAFHIRRAASEALQPLRGAIRDRAKVRFAYEDRKQERSARTVQPLGLFYWGATWSLGAWCELRRDFRNFRVDRMSALEILDEKFKPEPGRTLVDFFRAHDPDDSR
ncbi:MAG TPA: YafY family protein [Polyangia bacterium]|nr:YafY family protein [Polyangia bacterium]